MTGLTEVPNGKLFAETITITLSNLGGLLAGDFADPKRRRCLQYSDADHS